MSTKITIALGVVIIIIAAVTWSLTQKNQDGLILYYGDGCSHCANVEKFLADNAIEQKVQVQKKEVYQNQKNAQELGQRAAKCGLPSDNVGIPVLWDGTNCLVGDQDIINFFQKNYVDVEQKI
ncbi:MAG: hypothetical protein A2445_05825 [Candidatus Jacksonbacteria bacterium RIFOXYC2_FULL_44_29]|nr:MAG: hypothetical protein A2240_05670 [Candidatus Jacksonbacteria bacterium RIFOXYA2_FULL_43_12]OGY76793.1 MAG: hypothetical protein A2295_00470 [Candidatus Jacksonbacteria bacterium RIFOXYB2_FULL_44_15]OGY79200.1 MAG: hypothetical protein A2445_05825 [Candidatus Jacksonbacteria bacterium RIFOXYC2_FULL_44_29]OGY82081.1 MAG: hypothetical protein A2550_00055 [Candidatus Jacksonbacteria bacterium RIFOXYD2_FULL_43_21]HBH46903.1 hypothetical protein [Candidatus Jacksonbacteria bacterium]